MPTRSAEFGVGNSTIGLKFRDELLVDVIEFLTRLKIIRLVHGHPPFYASYLE